MSNPHQIEISPDAHPIDIDGPDQIEISVTPQAAAQIDIVPVGLAGKPGTNGTNGKTVELRRDDDAIEWRYADSPTWLQLVPIDELKSIEADLNGGFF